MWVVTVYCRPHLLDMAPLAIEAVNLDRAARRAWQILVERMLAHANEGLQVVEAISAHGIQIILVFDDVCRRILDDVLL